MLENIIVLSSDEDDELASKKATKKNEFIEFCESEDSESEEIVKKVIRKRKKVRVIPSKSAFQRTKRSDPNINTFSQYSYKNGKTIKRSRRLKRVKSEIGSEDELSELDDSDTETSSEIGLDSDEQFMESDDDEVEKLFLNCESISAKIKVQLERLEKDSKNLNSDLEYISIEESNGWFQQKLSLKDYQLTGVNWLHMMYKSNVNGILADEMGLGKTIQAMSILAVLKYRYNINGLHLIVAPGSTLENWRRELNKWLPLHKVKLYHGTQEERAQLRRKFKSGNNKTDIILTTYTYFERESSSDDRTFFYNRKFVYSVFDEAHAIKNKNSQRYKRLVLINSKHRLLLSGTPVQNNLNELLTTLSFAMPKVFVAESQQLLDFFRGERKAKELKRLRKALVPFVLRRLKKDVLAQLPAKKEIVMKLDMEKSTQKRLYEETVQDYLKRKRLGLSSVDYEHVFTQLRKICNHPLLVQNIFGKVAGGVDRSISKLVKLFHQVEAFGPSATEVMIKREISQYSDWQLHLLCSEFSHSSVFDKMCLPLDALWSSTKCDVLKDLLLDLKHKNKKSVLFSQWTTLLDIFEVLLESLEIKYVRFDGQTAISERQTIVDTFNTDPTISVFLLSTRAGGLGINLTSADTVILHDLDFNPTIDQQATDRVHRIGQVNVVTVYKLVTKDTVDEGILAMQERKMKLDEKLFEKNRKIKKSDIKSILLELTGGR